MKSCAAIGGIALVIAVLLLGYCGYSVYTSVIVDFSKVAAAGTTFVDLYNKDDFPGSYALCAADYVARISLEEHTKAMKKAHELTGNLALGDQTSFSSGVVNGDKKVRLTYGCTTDKGDATMKMEFHEEGTWKVESYSVELK